MIERLQKLIAQAGVTSRREAETLIEQGLVTVNGRVAKLGDKADPQADDIRVEGARLRIQTARVYVALNKPMGVVTTVRAQEQEHRRTVLDLVPIREHLYPVGRLDADSEGLVLLTNDGELAQKLSHPRYQHPKVYEVALQGNIPDEALDIWRRGVVLDDGPTQPVDIRLLTRDKQTDMTWIRITMREGRKRQIRRIANILGYHVRRLVRTQLDTLSLGTLKPGEWRYLTPEEIQILQKSAASTRRRGKIAPQEEKPKPRRRPIARVETSARESSSAEPGRVRRLPTRRDKPAESRPPRRQSGSRRVSRPAGSPDAEGSRPARRSARRPPSPPTGRGPARRPSTPSTNSPNSANRSSRPQQRSQPRPQSRSQSRPQSRSQRRAPQSRPGTRRRGPR
jgi:pseudouridine synthase